MNYVRPKKSLGQHFLRDKNIALKIVGSLQLTGADCILEIGPGKGILSLLLQDLTLKDLKFIEVDSDSVEFLGSRLSQKYQIIHGDFLKFDLKQLFNEPFIIIGNFPYNISSQIFFRILGFRDLVTQIVCMVQQEVAGRIASAPGSRKYGILSVLLQAYYNIEYLFTVNPGVFEPPPRVRSAVIRLTRNGVAELGCDENLFALLIKSAFNQRRKMLKNSLEYYLKGIEPGNSYLRSRPEQLSTGDFIALTKIVEKTQTEGSG